MHAYCHIHGVETTMIHESIASIGKYVLVRCKINWIIWQEAG